MDRNNAVDFGLGTVFALGIAGTILMLVDSWGGASWTLTTTVSVVVSGLALLRRRHRALTAVAGLAATAVGIGVSAATDLPQEPGPVTALALAVLVGSALRTLPPARACGLALASLAVLAGAWVSGDGAVLVLATLACAAALALGTGLRALDRDDATPARGGPAVGRQVGGLSRVTLLDRGLGLTLTAGFGALFLVVLLGQAVSIERSWGGWYWLPGTTAAVAVCLLALARRRQRTRATVAALTVAAAAVIAAGVADLPQEPSPATALGLSVLVGSAVRTLPPRTAGCLAAGGLAVVAGGQLAARPTMVGITGVTGLTAVLLLTAVAAGLWLRLLDDRARATAQQVRQEERLELARELHDIVAHHLTGMLIQAQAAQVVGRRDPSRVTDSLADIETCATDALTAMRRVVGLLRDDASPTSPGPEGLDALVERFNRQGRQGRQGPRVALRMPDATDGQAAWPPEVTSTVYHVTREALTNVLRHAPHADSVTVTVDRSPREVTVEVADDAPRGGPARATHRGGYGLIGMRERVEALGGTLSAGPAPGTGWSVRATLPVPTREPR